MTRDFYIICYMREKKISAARDISECALFVALMAVGAFVQIPFPLVPLTFQTVISVVCGLLLGAKKGAASMAAYAVAGLIGLPVFSGGGGIYYVLKPSFGYILGFILSAAVAGLIAGRAGLSLRRYIIAALAGFIADYAVGIPYCLIAAHLLGVADLWGLLVTGNLIYMPKDAALCILAAVLARKVCPFFGRAIKNRKIK